MTDLYEAQIARAPIAEQRANAKVEALASLKTSPRVPELLKKASKTARSGKRIRLVLEAASLWAGPAIELSACRRGCSHCCSLPSIAITSAEARLLRDMTGREMVTPAGGMTISEMMSDPGARLATEAAMQFDSPCPFLSGGECAVYEHRPVVCRTHANMDDIPLLCERVPGLPVDVPYLNNLSIWGAVLSLQENEVLADIRQFFPSN